MKCHPCNGDGNFANALRPVFSNEKVAPEEAEVEIPDVEEFGKRNVRRMLDPKLPTKKEVEEHNLTHLPFRNWCPHCVAGKGKAASHFKQERQDGMPEIHVDYCFLSTKNGPLATVLVAKERGTKMVMSTVVPMKGGSIEFPARRTLAFIRELGLESSDIVFKSDQEPAIVDLLNAIGKRRCAKTKLESARDADPRDPSKPLGRSIQESSPVGSSASNGFIEKGIQDVEGQARTIKHALETRIGSKVPSDHDVIPWMLEYTAVLTNRCQVGIDGKRATKD